VIINESIIYHSPRYNADGLEVSDTIKKLSKLRPSHLYRMWYDIYIYHRSPIELIIGLFY